MLHELYFHRHRVTLCNGLLLHNTDAIISLYNLWLFFTVVAQFLQNIYIGCQHIPNERYVYHTNCLRMFFFEFLQLVIDFNLFDLLLIR